MLATTTTPFASLHNKEQTNPCQKIANIEENSSASTLTSTQIIPIKSSSLLEAENRVEFKIAFQKYSRIHYHFKLRFSTLFHATSLYANCLKLFKMNKISFSQDYLTICCLHLSMKYEEIYPPRLSHITSFFKSTPIDIAIYRQEERKVINILNGSLDVVTAKQIVDECLKNQPERVHFYAYYLLEISFFDIMIPSSFTMAQICLAIILIMAQSDQNPNKPSILEKQITDNVKNCAKLIAAAKSRLKIHQIEYLSKKYSKTEFMKVSEEKIFIQNQ